MLHLLIMHAAFTASAWMSHFSTDYDQIWNEAQSGHGVGLSFPGLIEQTLETRR